MQRPLVNLAGLPCLALATASLLLWVQWSCAGRSLPLGPGIMAANTSGLVAWQRASQPWPGSADLRMGAAWGQRGVRVLRSHGDRRPRFWGIFQQGEECRPGGGSSRQTLDHTEWGWALGKGPPWAWSRGALEELPTPQGASARRGRPWHPQELGCRKEGWEDKGATDKQPHLPRRSGPKFWTRWNQRGHLEQQIAGLVLGRWPPPLQPTGSEPTTRVVLQHLSPASSRHRQGRRG